MSSASISEIKSYFVGNVMGASQTPAKSNGEESFSQIFNKTSETGGEEVKLSASAKQEASSIQEHADIQRKSSQTLQEKAVETERLEEEEMLQEAAQEAGAELIREVADTFKVTVQEVEQVMETLGLNPLDLFVPENLVQLVLGINQGIDVLTITTDEQLFADLKNLMNMAENLMNQMAEEFGLTKEQLAGMLQEFSGQLALQQQATEDFTGEITGGDPTDTANVQKLINESVEEAAQPKVELEVDSEEAAPITQKESALNGRAAETAEVTEESQAAATDTVKKADGKQQSGTNQDGNQNLAGDSFRNNLLNQLSQAVENTVAGTQSGQVSGTEIIQQITEYIRVAVNADTTELELQLTPESLGNVKVQIASKAGVLTATFVTENEAVKAVLESQMIQLKESFEEQGLKVESVEVNVEARGFERNLDQENQEQRDLEEAQKRNGRRITLTGLEDGEELLDEDLSEGDRIVADMMRRNGNTVDYTA